MMTMTFNFQQSYWSSSIITWIVIRISIRPSSTPSCPLIWSIQAPSSGIQRRHRMSLMVGVIVLFQMAGGMTTRTRSGWPSKYAWITWVEAVRRRKTSAWWLTYPSAVHPCHLLLSSHRTGESCAATTSSRWIVFSWCMMIDVQMQISMLGRIIWWGAFLLTVKLRIGWLNRGIDWPLDCLLFSGKVLPQGSSLQILPSTTSSEGGSTPKWTTKSSPQKSEVPANLQWIPTSISSCPAHGIIAKLLINSYN